MLPAFLCLAFLVFSQSKLHATADQIVIAKSERTLTLLRDAKVPVPLIEKSIGQMGALR